MAGVIRRAAVLAGGGGSPAAALRLLTAADVLTARIGTAQALPERIAYERAQAQAEDSLGASAARSMATAARDMPLAAVLADAQRVLAAIAGDPLCVDQF